MGSSVSVSYAAKSGVLLAALGLLLQGCAYDSYMSDNDDSIHLLALEAEELSLEADMPTAEESAAQRAKLESADVYRGSAVRFRDLGDRDNATANYRKALELYPDHHLARFELAELLAQDEDSQEEAIALLKDLLHRLRRRTDKGDGARIRQSAEALLLGLDEKGMALTDAAAVLAAYGVRAEKANRLENALELYGEALRLWPACTEARVRARKLCEKYGWEMPDEIPLETTPEVFLELSELTPKSVDVKNGALLVNKTKWGMPFYNRGAVFNHGLWTPAPSRVTFELARGYSRLTVKVLISAFAGPEQQVATLEKELVKPRSGTANFKIHGDGMLLAESGVMSYSSDPRELTVDVGTVRELTLECDPADGSDLLDFSVWADGKLHLK